EDARLTKTGSMLGTPAYMPPEQVSGDVQAMGPGCDIYSLGVILYELLTRRIPFEGTMINVLSQIITERPAPPSPYRPHLDLRLEAVCLKAMAKQIPDRYATMGEFAEALAPHLDRATAGARPDGKRPRRRLPRWLLVAFLGLLAGLLVGVGAFLRSA